MKKSRKVKWSELLETALTHPGKLSAAYRAFHRFSFGNQVLAMEQCAARGIPMGPINTYKGWQALGRQVRRGEKAVFLCMPVSAKKALSGQGRRAREKSLGRELTEEESTVSARFFVYRANWFVVSQTDGEAQPNLDLPNWNAEQATAALGVRIGRFDMPNGNMQGYQCGDTVAINPVAEHPHRTLFHELAHAELHRELSDQSRGEQEMEAECTAMLVADALGLKGLEESRGYVQSWYKGERIPEKSAKRILIAARLNIKV